MVYVVMSLDLVRIGADIKLTLICTSYYNNYEIVRQVAELMQMQIIEDDSNDW